MKYLFMLLSLALGIFYYSLIQVDISTIKGNDFTLTSKIEQSVLYHVQGHHKKARFECNKKKVFLDNTKEHDYFYHGDEFISIPLKAGENHCRGWAIQSQFKQKLTYTNFLILSILVAIPLFTLIFSIFMKLLEKINLPQFNSREKEIKEEEGSRNIYYAIWATLLLGVAIRILYFEKFGIYNFQHDWHGHIEFIKYMAENWSLPMPPKGLEYPQQPLYYMITGGLYNLFQLFGFNSNDALYGIGIFSLLCSLLFLWYSYRLLSLLTHQSWVKLLAMIFLSLTPSLVYLSARINNDSLIILLAVMTLYYIVKSYNSAFKKDFYLALFMVTLLFLTKISSASFEILFFLLLIVVYKRTPTQESRRAIYLFGLVGLLLLSFTLLRVYMPIDNHFHLVNSAKFPKQTLEELNFGYFATFHLFELVQVGYSYVFGEDAIRHSFLTYQYGTMLFGEFDYTDFINRAHQLSPIMRTILISGLIFPIGLILFFTQLHRESTLNKLLTLTLLINFILVLKFIFDYPSICNTDFRYYVPSFVIIGFFMAQGVNRLRSVYLIQLGLDYILTILVTAELLFFYFLLYP